MATADTGSISDGYHTFNELYEHRHALYIALCRSIDEVLQFENPGRYLVWRSKRHSDGTLPFGGGWFILGIGTEKGKQITYHLPMERWGELDYCHFKTLMKAPEYDGHTSDDVVKRLLEL